MRLSQSLPLCALALLMIGSMVGCESGQRLNRGEGPSNDHYLFSVQDSIPGDAWSEKEESDHVSYGL